MIEHDSTDPTTPETPRARRLDRRAIVGGVALGTVAVGAGAVGAFAGQASAGRRLHRRRVAVDIACLAESMSFNIRANPENDSDIRSAFVVEGRIYPEGTIKGDGFIPREDGSIGWWICRGEFLSNAARPAPHISANVSIHFGAITRGSPFPRSSLHTLGISGTDDRAQSSWRAVVGGTGPYMGARGEVGERVIATNTTKFADTGDPGPCWRDVFDFWVPGAP